MALQRIETDAIEDDAITTAKIAANAVAAADIAANAITNAKVASNAAIAVSKVSGLGTAATLNVGTSANNIVQLDGSAKLPAVDGSNLTGVATDTSAMENNIAILAFKTQAANNLAKFNLIDQVVDEYEDDSGLLTETNVNRSDGYISSVYGSAVDSNYVFVIQSDTTNNSQSFTDNSANNHAITYANQTKQSTDQEKIGNSSIYFDGSADQLRATNAHSDFAFGTGDFTVEAWIRWDAQASNKTLIGNRQGAVNDAWMFYISTSNNLAFSSGTAILLSSSSTIAATTWTHCAVVRDSGTLRIYKDGTQVGTASNSNNFSSTNRIFCGAGDTQGNSDFAGYMDEIRISNNCRYPSGTSFTPSTTAFSGDSNTKLLIQSNTTNNSTTFTDTSPIFGKETHLNGWAVNY